MKRLALSILLVFVSGIIYAGTTYLHPTSTASPSNNTIYGKNNSGTVGFHSAITMDDSAAQIQNSTDSTKKVKIDASGITTGNTRTLTWPDRDWGITNMTVISTTAPATPSNGQSWYQPRANDSGGAILWRYSSALSKWCPEVSFGDLTFYIDYTNGTDDPDHGTGTTTSAFKTRTYAVFAIPPIYGGNVTINEVAETEAEGYIFVGKRAASQAGNRTITVNGTKTTIIDAATADSYAAGSGSTQGSVVDENAFGSVVAGDVIYNSGLGVYRCITSVTGTGGDVASIAGTWGGTPSGTYSVYRPGTIVNCNHGANTVALEVRNCDGDIVFNDISFQDGATYTSFITGCRGSVTRNRCSFVSTASSAAYLDRAWYNAECLITDNQNYFNQTGNKGGIGCNQGYHVINGCFFGDANNAAYYAGIGGYVEINYGTTVIHTGPQGYGGYAENGGRIKFTGSSANGYERISYCTTGLYATTGAQIIGTANNVYASNTADETLVSASYGYID